MKNQYIQTAKRILGAAGLAALLSYPMLALAQAAVSNGAGVSLAIESSTDSSFIGQQSNAAGVTLQLTSSFDSSVDTTNGAGITAYVGQVDPQPIAVQHNAAGVTWKMY